MRQISIVSYNLNGIRSAMNKGFTNWLEATKPDIICLQEIKANAEQVDATIFQHLGYEQYWFSAEKKGYSGVAVFTKIKPINVTNGCGIYVYDVEGRILKLDFEDFSLVNTYFPSGSSGEHRQVFKMQFLEDYLPLLKKWQQQHNNLIVCGDFNICHKAIDIHDPISNKNSSGFLPEERAWMDAYFETGMIDTFRHFNKNPQQYSWWSYRAAARTRNKGWRIDYITTSKSLEPHLKSAIMHQEDIHSDHCGVMLNLRF